MTFLRRFTLVLLILVFPLMLCAAESVHSITLPGATATGIGMDYIGFDAATNSVWVPAGNTGAVDVLDVPSGKVRQITGFPAKEKEKLTFEGHTEGLPVGAKRQRFSTNIDDRDLTRAVDLKTHKTVETWKSACGAEGPHGLRVDESNRHLFVACSPRVEVIDAGHDGAVLSSIDTGDGVDDIDYSAKTHQLYVGAARAGKL